ncbi:hypothetical protein CHS0354_026327 [Potamilus streckersoni]|uniref:Uncharacterized protein n=1 Tax=Potamilus streckersoni TaxID=2493646 RepID=A0AAE0T3N8_9BIVA|nr:hypothetical protein CHS0354_026327 [Potamilus streckersoni]
MENKLLFVGSRDLRDADDNENVKQKTVFVIDKGTINTVIVDADDNENVKQKTVLVIDKGTINTVIVDADDNENVK